MANYLLLEAFYRGLVTALRGRGARAAITSGMACVH